MVGFLRGGVEQLFLITLLSIPLNAVIKSWLTNKNKLNQFLLHVMRWLGNMGSEYLDVVESQ